MISFHIYFFIFYLHLYVYYVLCTYQVKTHNDLSHFETAYVVKLHRVARLAPAQAVRCLVLLITCLFSVSVSVYFLSSFSIILLWGCRHCCIILPCFICISFWRFSLSSIPISHLQRVINDTRSYVLSYQQTLDRL